MLNNVLNYKNIISVVLIIFVLFVHGYMRISALEHGNTVIGGYFWYSSINVGAGKGFTADTGFLKSPELKEFFDIPYLTELKDKKAVTLSTFTDYNIGSEFNNINESFGYRYLIGIIWKFFGFNWLYVSFLSYLFSLIAVMSLMYISYRTLGLMGAFFTGLVYAISLPEIRFTVDLGRDCFPLWFSAYLGASLYAMFQDIKNLKKIVCYAILNGVIIFLAVMGRSSAIFFFPITVILYFLLYLYRSRHDSTLSKNAQNYLKPASEKLCNGLYLKLIYGRKISSILILTIITSLITIITYIFIFSIFLLTIPPIDNFSTLGGFMHVIFLGIGTWSSTIKNLSYPYVYKDVLVSYQATEYGIRHFSQNWNPDYLSHNYGVALIYYYIDTIVFYPYLFIKYVFMESFTGTLFSLAMKPGFFPSIQGINHYIYSIPLFFYDQFYTKGCLLLFTVPGAIFLYYKREINILLISLIFILSNSSMSFMQYSVRHSLMPHPFYYLFIGASFTLVCTYAYQLTMGNGKRFLLSMEVPLFRGNIRKNLISVLVLMVSLFGTHHLLLKVYAYARGTEKNNIINFIVEVNNLQKHPVDINGQNHQLTLKGAAEAMPVGIYCKLGKIDAIRTVETDMFDGLVMKTFTAHPSNNAILFIPYLNKESLPKVKFLSQCQSIEWADISHIKGALWQGVYDVDTLIPQEGSYINE